MANKTLKYDTYTKLNKLCRLDGSIISSSTQTYVDSTVADATWSRPYPIGCRPPTGLAISETVYDTGTYVRFVTGGYREGDASFVYGSSNHDLVNWSTDDGALALARARSKMAGSDYSFGTSLAEFGDTVDVWVKTISRLYRGFKALKEGKLGKAIDNLRHEPSAKTLDKLKKQKPSKRLSDGYLEFTFGWLPQINDAYNVLDVYTKGLSSRGDFVRKRSGMSGESVDSSNYQRQTGRAVVSGYVRNERARNLNELGLLNPLATAWEVLPFSFLADWFIPAGTVLGGLTASAGLVCYSQCVITQRGSLSRYGGVDYRKIRYVTREPVSGLMSLEPFRPVALSMGQYFTAAALLRSLS